MRGRTVRGNYAPPSRCPGRLPRKGEGPAGDGAEDRPAVPGAGLTTNRVARRYRAARKRRPRQGGYVRSGHVSGCGLLHYLCLPDVLGFEGAPCSGLRCPAPTPHPP